MTSGIVVIGAGFGGLMTALRLAEQGVAVTLCERLAYPGGCASTFERDGYRFEAGATLFSGFAEGQLFRRLIDRHAPEVEIEWLDPVVELRTPGSQLAVPRSREAFVDAMCQRAGADAGPVRAFFDAQHRAANTLWAFLDEPERLPPAELAALLRWDTLRLLPWVGRPLERLLERHRVSENDSLRLYLDAVCQITVQCSSREAETLFALGAMDYYFRGTAHVRGGIGTLAWALVRTIRALGGEVHLANPVRGLRREGSLWYVTTKRETLVARAVAANLLPQSVTGLLGDTPPPRLLERLSRRTETGYGAAMLYRIVRSRPGADDGPRHLQLVADPKRPLVEGNHVFCSLSGAGEPLRAPDGCRTLTASTHVELPRLLSLDTEQQSREIEAIQDRMRTTLSRLAPEWNDVVYEVTASPRTFERFTGRHLGFVGGIPRRAGLSQYRDAWIRPALPGLYLVGDSMFPGQSTLAAAAGGYKLADRLAGKE